jgi:hypothetical protein
MSRHEVTEVELPICHHEGGRPETEVVEVECVGPNRSRLLDSPGCWRGWRGAT